MSAIIDSRDPRAASIGPSAESQIWAGLQSDIVSAAARNRPDARIETASGSIDLVSVFAEVISYKECGNAFIAALSDVLAGKDASSLADWVQLAAKTYADHTADLIYVNQL